MGDRIGVFMRKWSFDVQHQLRFTNDSGCTADGMSYSRPRRSKAHRRRLRRALAHGLRADYDRLAKGTEGRFDEKRRSSNSSETLTAGLAPTNLEVDDLNGKHWSFVRQLNDAGNGAI